MTSCVLIDIASYAMHSYRCAKKDYDVVITPIVVNIPRRIYMLTCTSYHSILVSRGQTIDTRDYGQTAFPPTALIDWKLLY